METKGYMGNGQYKSTNDAPIMSFRVLFKFIYVVLVAMENIASNYFSFRREKKVM